MEKRKDVNNSMSYNTLYFWVGKYNVIQYIIIQISGRDGGGLAEFRGVCASTRPAREKL